MICPSCGGRGSPCPSCGAVYLAGRGWHPGPAVKEGDRVPDPKQLKTASMESFLLCPTCSEEAGEEVFVHKSHLQTRQAFLRPAERTCPKGHVIPEAAS